jgi:hypothetical protein
MPVLGSVTVTDTPARICAVADGHPPPAAGVVFGIDVRAFADNAGPVFLSFDAALSAAAGPRPSRGEFMQWRVIGRPFFDPSGGRVMAKSRRETFQALAPTFARMRRRYPRMALPLVDKIEAGSMAAAVKLKCLECSSFVRQEVRDCVIKDCALYPFRPYQRLTSTNPNDPGQRGPAPLTYADPG